VRISAAFSFFAALACVPAGAEPTFQLKGLGQTAGPNARASQRPTGPNARAAQRPVGPNGALARDDRLVGRYLYYPSCPAAGAVRATPLRRGEPGYGSHLDPDGNGVACD